MNIQIDSRFLSDIAGSHNTIDTVQRADTNSTFREELQKKIGSDSENERKDNKLWDACVDFESIFVSKLFKEMRTTVHKGSILHGGHAEEIFEDFLYDEYAKITSKNSNIGIASMMYSQLAER